MRIISSLQFVLAAVLLLGIMGCDNRKGGNDFRAGRQALINGQFQLAKSRLEAFMAEYTGSSLRSRACLLIGKSNIGLGEFEEAASVFKGCMRDYPGSLEAHKSQYKLALLTMLRGERGNAIRQFREMADNPSGPYNPEARAMAVYLLNN